MALRARYGPGNRAWSYQRPDETANGPPPLPSQFGLAISAEQQQTVPETLTPITTAVDAVRAATGAAKARTRSDAGASTAAARAARSAKAKAARAARASMGSTPAAAAPPDQAPVARRRSERVPATAAKARPPSPTHTPAPPRATKRKRSALAPDVPAELGPDSESASVPPRTGLLPPPAQDTAANDKGAVRITRGTSTKRPRVSHKDTDVKPPRVDEPDDFKRIVFGSTTSVPDPFTALSASELPSALEQNGQPQPDAASTAPAADTPGIRRLPPGVPVHNLLKGLYLRYPVSQVGLPKEVLADVPDLDKNVVTPPNTTHNSAPFLNLYAPRRTRGIGADKHGLCPICAEPPSRGGRGKATMLNMKTSAFNYHMQYVHGLSPKTGLPFSPPIEFRASSRKAVGAREKSTLEEGLCHACLRWIVVEGVKAVEVLVPEIYWWKHASTCHKSRMLEGEGDFYIEDPLFLRIIQWQREHPTAAAREPSRASSANANHVPIKKDDTMDVDVSAGPVVRRGAVTPVRRDLEDPDSSPLSSLDGTDANSPMRKLSAPALGILPSANSPFAPKSPTTARARSAEGGMPGGSMTIGVPAPLLQNQALGTPRVVNHVLPGALPDAPPTAHTTPLVQGVVLPATHSPGNAGHEVNQTTTLVPLDQTLDKHSEEDAEGEDEDAEGEDDPTATAHHTPMLTQLPVLTPNLTQAIMSVPPVISVSTEQPATSSSIEQGQANVVDVSEHSVKGNAPVVPLVPEAVGQHLSNPIVEPAIPAPAIPVSVQVPVQENPAPTNALEAIIANAVVSLPQPTVSEELAAMIPPEFPQIQEMDMYASNNTPDESHNPQPVLTEEDLALANTGLAIDNQDTGMNIAGADMSLDPAGAPPSAPQPTALGLSSGEATPNAGGEPDMFAFWDVNKG